MSTIIQNMEHLLNGFVYHIKNPTIIKLVLIIVPIIFLLILWSRRRFYFLSVKLPGPLGIPLIGNALEMKLFTEPKKLIHVLEQYKTYYGGIFRIWLGPEIVIVLTEAEDIKCVSISATASSKGTKYDILKTVVGDGLLTASGDIWKRHRRIINPSFNKNFLKTLFNIHNKHAKIMTDSMLKLEDNSSVDVTIYTLRCIADIINDSLFGNVNHFYNGKNDGILYGTPDIANLFYDRICKFWEWNDFIYKKSINGKKLFKLRENYYNYYVPIFDKKVDEYIINKIPDDLVCDENDNENMKNSFQVMADAIIAGKMTKNELINEFHNIYNPGLDTLYSTLCIFIMMLAMHKNCQDKVWLEIQEVFSDDLDAEVTPDHLPKLKYIDMCLRENSRLHPTGPTQMRYLDEDLELPHRNLTLPKGTNLILATYSLHRNIKYWKKPNEFNPDRFKPEIAKERPDFSFVPFSAGLRNCIGQFFAFDILKTIIVYLIRNLEFDTDLTLDEFVIDADISVRSAMGHIINVKKRNRN